MDARLRAGIILLARRSFSTDPSFICDCSSVWLFEFLLYDIAVKWFRRCVLEVFKAGSLRAAWNGSWVLTVRRDRVGSRRVILTARVQRAGERKRVPSPPGRRRLVSIELLQGAPGITSQRIFQTVSQRLGESGSRLRSLFRVPRRHAEIIKIICIEDP